LNIMKKDSDVNDGNWAIAEATFIAQELKGGYYNSASTEPPALLAALETEL